MLSKVSIGALACVALVACSGGSQPPSHSEADPVDVAPNESHTRDADGDTFIESLDCDDTDASVWRIISAFADADADGVGAGPALDTCAGSALSSGLSASSSDCDDSDPDVAIAAAYGARDHDGDGRVVASAGEVCEATSALPGGYLQSVGAADLDCDDQNITVWRITRAYEDYDRDGVGHGVSLTVCAGDDTPPGFASETNDCDDRNGTAWRIVATYSDGDGDGVGSGPFALTCVGASAPHGSSFLGFDPADSATDPSSALISEADLDLNAVVYSVPVSSEPTP